jgi:phosphate transport system substrate-binding protein
MLKKVKIGYVQCNACADSPYVKPVQESIRTRRYPLVRGLYYVIKENYRGLGTGFVSFLKNERGQLIFKRAYLGTVMEFGVRNVKINQSLPEN